MKDYPWRVHIRRDSCWTILIGCPRKSSPTRLDYVRKWPPEHWTLAFQGPHPRLARTDFGNHRGRDRAQRAPEAIPRGLSRLKELYTFPFPERAP